MQNILAPPKQKLVRDVDKKASTVDSQTSATSPKSDDKSEKLQTADEQAVENGSVRSKGEEESAVSAPNSPFARSAVGSPTLDSAGSDFGKIIGEDNSPRNQETIQETHRYGFQD